MMLLLFHFVALAPPCRSATCLSISRVVVLPALPVTATTLPSKRLRAALAMARSACRVLLTSKSGKLLGSFGSRVHCSRWITAQAALFSASSWIRGNDSLRPFHDTGVTMMQMQWGSLRLDVS